MKEVIRIHLARTVYEIEVDAKKQLETYTDAIARALEDDDMVADIEQRMCEILAEHGVQAGGIITVNEVQAIQEQLGAVSDFAAIDEETKEKHEVSTEQHVKKRLMRDPKNGLLGGVAVGLAVYFNTDATLVRVLFVALTFAGGFGIIAYGLLWLLLPAARTTIDRMAMEGQPANLGSIRSFSDRALEKLQQPISIGVKVFKFLLGLAGVVMIGAAILPLFIGGFITANVFMASPELMFPAGVVDWVAIVLAWIAALALAIIGTCAGLALIRRMWLGTSVRPLLRPIMVSGIVLLSAGLTMMVMVPIAGYNFEARLKHTGNTEQISLPAGAASVKKLVLKGQHNFAQVRYVADGSKPRVQVQTGQNHQQALKQLQFKVSGDQLEATYDESIETPKHCRGFFCDYLRPQVSSITIYGPALETIQSEAARMVYSSSSPQKNLNVSATEEFANITLEGNFEKVVANVAYANASINLGDAVIDSLEASFNGGSIFTGTLGNLAIKTSDNCKAKHTSNLYYGIKSGGSITVNNQPVTKKVLAENSCVNAEEMQ